MIAGLSGFWKPFVNVSNSICSISCQCGGGAAVIGEYLNVFSGTFPAAPSSTRSHPAFCSLSSLGAFNFATRGNGRDVLARSTCRGECADCEDIANATSARRRMALWFGAVRDLRNPTCVFLNDSKGTNVSASCPFTPISSSQLAPGNPPNSEANGSKSTAVSKRDDRLFRTNSISLPRFVRSVP